MGYYPDLTKISLDDYKDHIKNKTLIPSRKFLKLKIEKLMNIFQSMGFKNIDELLKVLKSKTKLEDMATKSGIDIETLNHLKREINSMKPRANKFRDFTFLDSSLLEKLEKWDLIDSKKLFNRILTKEDRIKLGTETDIEVQDIEILTRLTDLSRIQWVNHTFAYVLYEAGYNCLKKVQNADPNLLYSRIKKLNSEKKLYKGNIGLNDMRILIEASLIVPNDIEYN